MRDSSRWSVPPALRAPVARTRARTARKPLGSRMLPSRIPVRDAPRTPPEREASRLPGAEPPIPAHLLLDLFVGDGTTLIELVGGLLDLRHNVPMIGNTPKRAFFRVAIDECTRRPASPALIQSDDPACPSAVLRCPERSRSTRRHVEDPIHESCWSGSGG